MKPKAKATPHACIQRVNKGLAEHNTRLVFDLLGSGSIFIETAKVDPKKRVGPVSLAATFCPFCGERGQAIAIEDNK